MSGEAAMSTTKQGNPATSSPETIGRTRDDRVFRETRWLSAIIIPFLLAAFYILYLRSAETKALFAWEIKPRMTAMMLGATYIGGAYFFLGAMTAPRWHWIALGFLSLRSFSSFMVIATPLQ